MFSLPSTKKEDYLNRQIEVARLILDVNNKRDVIKHYDADNQAMQVLMCFVNGDEKYDRRLHYVSSISFSSISGDATIG